MYHISSAQVPHRRSQLVRQGLRPCLSAQNKYASYHWGLHNTRLPIDAKKCRGGCFRVETLSHVLQRCPVTHHPRIARHDFAVNTLADACHHSGLRVDVEPSIRDIDGRLHKPDLLVVTDCVSVIDVSINWESPRPLSEHYYHKVATYSSPSFVEAIRRRHPGLPISVGAIVIGARGTWCNLNNAVLQRLHLRRPVAQLLISGVLRGGLLIRCRNIIYITSELLISIIK